MSEKGNRKRGGKPKMASVWPSMSPGTVTLDQALRLLSFTRALGEHPDSKQPVTVQDGRYGPYVKMGAETRSLASQDELTTITLEQAVAKLAEPKRGRRGGSTAAIAELGAHPTSGAPIQVKSGRFGPYVTDGTVNATIPKGTDPESLGLEQAVELLARREEKLREQGKDPRAKKARKRR